MAPLQPVSCRKLLPNNGPQVSFFTFGVNVVLDLLRPTCQLFCSNFGAAFFLPLKPVKMFLPRSCDSVFLKTLRIPEESCPLG